MLAVKNCLIIKLNRKEKRKEKNNEQKILKKHTCHIACLPERSRRVKNINNNCITNMYL